MYSAESTESSESTGSSEPPESIVFNNQKSQDWMTMSYGKLTFVLSCFKKKPSQLSQSKYLD